MVGWRKDHLPCTTEAPAETTQAPNHPSLRVRQPHKSYASTFWYCFRSQMPTSWTTQTVCYKLRSIHVPPHAMTRERCSLASRQSWYATATQYTFNETTTWNPMSLKHWISTVQTLSADGHQKLQALQLRGCLCLLPRSTCMTAHTQITAGSGVNREVLSWRVLLMSVEPTDV